MQQATLPGKAVVESHGGVVVPKVSKVGGSSKKFGLKDALYNLRNIAVEKRRHHNKLIEKLLAVLAKGLGMDMLSSKDKAAELPKRSRNKRAAKASAPAPKLKSQRNKCKVVRWD